MHKIKIKINIADREYPMVVTPDEEEILRAAGRKINKIIKDFEQKYSLKDKQDGLAMCALQYVSKCMNLEKDLLQQDEMQSKKIKRLIEEINQNL